jgi:hypothetical protein
MLSAPRTLAALLVLTVSGIVGCPPPPPNDYGIVEPLQTTGEVLGSQGVGSAGPRSVEYPNTEVWPVENAWSDTDTQAAKAAGLAWREDSGLTWDQKYSLWVDALGATPLYSGSGTTYEIETPTGKVVQAPYLECAETAYFMRALFASWYHLPFYVEAVDGNGDRIFLGHFGFIYSDGSRYGSTPNFANYADHSDMTAADIASQGWPSDSSLRDRQLWGSSDEQPFLGEDAHYGAYFDELLLNKRVGYFMMLLLPYFGSIHFADDGISWHVEADQLVPGDVLIKRWQQTGTGHVMVVKEVQWMSSTSAAAEIVSGSMPRRQPRWESSTAAKMYFTSEYTGGEGSNYDGDAYVDLGGGLKSFLSTVEVNGYWHNAVPAARLDQWIPTSDTDARMARPAIFEDLLAQADADELMGELLSLVEEKREHLRNYPASCSAREAREQYFEQVYDLTQREWGWDRQRTDEEYRTLEDYVFAELIYNESKTCCWNSTTPEMYDIVMEYNTGLVEADPDTCVDPEVFKAEDGGYSLFQDYAISTGRGDQWVEWSADESCPQAGVSDDSEADHDWADYCDVEDAILGNEGGDDGDDDDDDDDTDTDGDTYEPNESSSDASELGEGGFSGLSIGSGDEDWFVVDANGSTVTARIDFSHAAGDLDMQLLDSNGSQISSSASTSDTEEVEGADDKVYVRVYGYNGATGDYDLTITVD